MRILVVGATGAVGRAVCREIARSLGDDALVVGDYNPDRGQAFALSVSSRGRFAAVDVRDRRSIERAATEVDAVIVAVRQMEPNVQIVCTDRGIPSVDIVPDTPWARSVFSPGQYRSDDRPLTGVVAAGLIPGLSGLMVRQVIEEVRRIGPDGRRPVVHVSLLQRRNGTAGAAGIADMLGLFARRVEYEGRHVRGFSRARDTRFCDPFGCRPVRLVAFPEASDVRAHFDLDRVRYWTAFDDDVFNGIIGALNRVGVLRRFREPGGGRWLAKALARGKAAPTDTEETVALTVEAGDTSIRLTATSDYDGTAMAAVAIARALVARDVHDYGLVVPFELFTLREIVDLIASAGLFIEVARGG